MEKSRKSILISQKKTWTAEKTLQKIQEKYPEIISVDKSTYVNTKFKALFTDKDFGDFWAIPNRLLKGGKHPNRSYRGMQTPVGEIKKKLPPEVTIIESTYLGTKKSATFIDKDYGEFTKIVEYVLNSRYPHPKRLSDRKKKYKLIHPDEIQSRLDSMGTGIKIKKETYIKMHSRAIFIDPKFGEWEALPYNVIFNQTRHPKHKNNPLIEQKVCNFLESKNINFKRNQKILKKDGYPLEIDIYLPDYNIGIEIDGLYWHCELNKEKYSNKEKHELAESQEIKLISFFEDEINFKFDLVCSIIANKLNITENKINARDCEVIKVSFKETRDFCNDNHLMGFRSSFLNIGLKKDGKLVQLITFGKNKKYGVELVRFCTVKNASVVGGFSKLMSHSQVELKKLGYNSIMSYADKRISNGQVYIKNGFKLDGITPPDMFWTDKEIRLSRRASWGKKDDQMRSEGYYKIFGTGHYRFIKDI